jgi:hypothetical protein
MAFAINYTTYPDSTVKRLVDSDLEAYYDRLEEESQSSISGEIILSQSFKVDGLTGRQVKYELQGGKLVLTSRLLLNGNQLYTWMVTNLKEKEFLTKKREFLEGLRIKN